MNTEPFGKSKEVLRTPQEVAKNRGQEIAEGGNVEETQEMNDVVKASETSVESSATQSSSSTETSAPPAPVAIVQKDRLTKEVEAILEDDLKDLYVSMPPERQIVFRQKGEETLSKIRVLLTQTKINTKKIFGLIREWLKLIPGVNRFFLEQEAKIKTDKILLVSEEERKEPL